MAKSEKTPSDIDDMLKNLFSKENMAKRVKYTSSGKELPSKSGKVAIPAFTNQDAITDWTFRGMLEITEKEAKMEGGSLVLVMSAEVLKDYAEYLQKNPSRYPDYFLALTSVDIQCVPKPDGVEMRMAITDPRNFREVAKVGPIPPPGMEFKAFASKIWPSKFHTMGCITPVPLPEEDGQVVTRIIFIASQEMEDIYLKAGDIPNLKSRLAVISKKIDLPDGKKTSRRSEASGKDGPLKKSSDAKPALERREQDKEEEK